MKKIKTLVIALSSLLLMASCSPNVKITDSELTDNTFISVKNYDAFYTLKDGEDPAIWNAKGYEVLQNEDNEYFFSYNYTIKETISFMNDQTISYSKEFDDEYLTINNSSNQYLSGSYKIGANKHITFIFNEPCNIESTNSYKFNEDGKLELLNSKSIDQKLILSLTKVE